MRIEKSVREIGGTICYFAAVVPVASIAIQMGISLKEEPHSFTYTKRDVSFAKRGPRT